MPDILSNLFFKARIDILYFSNRLLEVVCLLKVTKDETDGVYTKFRFTQNSRKQRCHSTTFTYSGEIT